MDETREICMAVNIAKNKTITPSEIGEMAIRHEIVIIRILEEIININIECYSYNKGVPSLDVKGLCAVNTIL